MTKPIEAVYRQLGARVESIRSVLGITQEELAKRMGSIGRTSIVNFEAGKQRLMLHNIEGIAKALGTTPKHLLRGIWT